METKKRRNGIFTLVKGLNMVKAGVTKLKTAKTKLALEGYGEESYELEKIIKNIEKIFQNHKIL